MMNYELPKKNMNMEELYTFLYRTIEKLNENNTLLQTEIENLKDELKAQKGD